MERVIPSVDRILEEAVGIASAVDRQTFVDRACDGHPILQDEVERLIANHFRAGDFLERPAAVLGTAPVPSGDDAVGTVVGPYKLLELIGEGGMGLVYVAEQQRPVRRTVAIKLVKPGMDTKQVVARFEAERQALALMDHPNIAKVLDAGVTDAGRPYFVMELVRGIPITEYCDQARLTVRRRLGVFVQVCRAVQHAHTKGVLHRDLKPTNVLVTSHDGVPVPVVIDFGVAKALGQRLTEQTMHTGFAQIVGTPLYMSPEQAEFNDLGIDTRSDVYSLGVLLYELLTGTTPFDGDRLRTAGFDEFRRILREEEPPRPSNRLGTLGATFSTVSQRRGVDARKLSRTLHGELDWIVLRALEKDRTRRYETASALAADVERYLSDEAVEACPPSVGYRMRKFVRRNRLKVSAAAVVGTLVATLTGEAWYLVRDEATRRHTAEQRVEEYLREADRFEGLGQWPGAHAEVEKAVAVVGGSSVGDEVLDRVRGTQRWLVLVERLEEIRMSRIERFLVQLDRDSSPRDYAEAFRTAGLDWECEPPDELARRVPPGLKVAVAAFLDDWAATAPNPDRLQAAARVVDPDEFRCRVREARIGKDRVTLTALAEDNRIEHLPPPSLVLLGDGLWKLHLREQAVAVLTRGQKQHPNDVWLNLKLGHYITGGGGPPRWAEAARYNTAAVALRPESGVPWNNLGFDLFNLGNRAGAVAAIRRAVQLRPDKSHHRQGLAWMLSAMGDLDGALEAAREAVRLGPEDFNAHSLLSVILFRREEYTEAIAEAREVVRLKPRDDINLSLLAHALRNAGRLDEAVATFKEGILVNPNYSRLHSGLSITLRMAGDTARAVGEARRAVRLDPDYFDLQILLGRALWENGEGDEAVEAWRKAVKLFRERARKRPDDWVEIRDAALFLAGVPDASVRDAKAAVELARTAVELAPQMWDCPRALALAHYQDSDWSAAVAACDAVDRLRPAGDPNTMVIRAMALHRLGKRQEARQLYERAVPRLRPDVNPELMDLRKAAAAAFGTEVGTKLAPPIAPGN